MLKTWKIMSSIARSEALLHHDDLPIPVDELNNPQFTTCLDRDG